MKSLPLLVFVSVGLFGFGSTSAEEPEVKDLVRLGVTVAKPADEVYAQLPVLTRGCGFVLKEVTPGSSAAKVGLKPLDVIWKLDDQLLINEGQLSVLLALHKPGDEVKLDYFQSGQMKQALMTLYASDVETKAAASKAADFPFPLNPTLPMHVVSYEDKSASITDEKGTATLRFNNGKQWLVILTPEGEEALKLLVDDALDLSEVPASWRAKLPVLQRSLKHSVSLRKLPRVRRVPNPKPDLVDGVKK